MTMDIKDLEIFYMVAQTGNMTRAAERLGFVQSHITGVIRRLESELHQPLFERSKRGVALTAQGQRLYPHVESLLAQWNQARSVFLDESELFGTLRIGSLETTAALHAAGWIAAYHQENPSVDISLKTGTTRELLQGVIDRELDIAFVAGSVDHVELQSKALVHEELSMITALGQVPENMLANDPVIITFREGCSYRRILERWMADRGIGLYRTMESASIETILQLTAGGLGVSIMPISMITRSPMNAQLTAHPLSPAIGLVTTYAVWRRGQQVPRTISALVEQLPSIQLSS